jgi:hypothetical protein
MRRLCLQWSCFFFCHIFGSHIFFPTPRLNTHVSQWCANLFMISTLKSISTGSQVCDLAKKNFSHPRFSYPFFQPRPQN